MAARSDIQYDGKKNMKTENQINSDKLLLTLVIHCSR